MKRACILASIFLLSALPGWCAAPKAAKPAKSGTTKTAPAKKTDSAVTVYYFHGNARCASCHKIEQYTKEAVGQYFSSGTYAGRVKFVPVNVDENANAHFIKEYKLVSKSVVLQTVKNGKPGSWENLDRIWLELGDKNKFIAYVKGGILKALESK